MSKAASNVIIPAPEKAFRRSSEYKFRKQKLEPFSHLRQTCAIELGLKYWSLNPEDFKTIRNPEKDRLKDKKLPEKERAEIEAQPAEIILYGGIYHDAAIIMWVCHQPDEVCIDARQDPRTFIPKIDKWADENGLGFKGKNLPEALNIFMQILNDLTESSGIPDAGNEEGNGEDEENP